MIFAYEKFSSIFKRELFLLSTDYPYLYKKFDSTNILFGEKCHWRTVKESLLTFLTSKKMILKYFEKLDEMSKIENNPFEKNLHDIYKNEICLSPVPTLSIHCTNVYSVFGLSPTIQVMLFFLSLNFFKTNSKFLLSGLSAPTSSEVTNASKVSSK